MQVVSHLPRRRKAHTMLLPVLIALALSALLMIAFNVWGDQISAPRPLTASEVTRSLPIYQHRVRNSKQLSAQPHERAHHPPHCLWHAALG